MALVRTLIDRAQSHSEPALPPGLSEMYDGDLHFPESSISEEISANRLANARRTVLLEMPAGYRLRIAAVMNEPPRDFS
jgi:hypothetical protein